MDATQKLPTVSIVFDGLPHVGKSSLITGCLDHLAAYMTKPVVRHKERVCRRAR